MATSTTSGSQRFVSVDAMRGLTVGSMIFVNNPGDWSHVIGHLFSHAAWDGCTPMDLIFPTFLFIVGVSLSLAAGPRMEAGVDMAGTQRAIWWRSLRLVLLGWALAAIAVIALPSPPDEHIPWRPMGILPRIGICFALGGWVYLHTRSTTRWWIYGALVVGYGLLLKGGGDLSREHSLPSIVDAWILGPHAFHYDAVTHEGYDPEGILSTLGALSNTILGMQCGDWLRRREVRPIVMTGAVFAVLGFVLNFVWMPMNKSLWTPPFAIFSGGVSALALALVHTLIERRHWPPIGRRFGTNAITAFAGSVLLLCLLEGTPLKAHIYPALSAWLTPIGGPKLPSHVFAALQVGFWWVVVWWLDKRNIRISI